ncbi:ethanolamine utilization protein [Clostridium sp. AWRP]|uniref:ethanolamine utilization protein n=1 Tax=Clostridium sp. AWRP TaxID=2212991 RepID=UPI000FDCD434|nr:ethanolamine utilization protein [Clostridium sp. AWRP]AZV56190.1 ethanolamine utilization protein [Clostridium sp. AWRP]
MKFITEIDLRDLYRKEPFTDYELKLGTRLTPEASQFLSDKGINMFDDESYYKNKNVVNKGQPVEKKQDVDKKQAVEKKETVEKVQTINENQIPAQPKKKNNWKKKKLYSKMKSTEALFLITEEELLNKDILWAQNVISLGKQFTKIKNAIQDKGSVENLCIKECTAINFSNYSLDLDDCFEITEFHMQLKKGRDIIILHRLRCALREIEPFILEAYEDSEDEDALCSDIIGKINQIINALSQMICSIFGGTKCQRKI